MPETPQKTLVKTIALLARLRGHLDAAAPELHFPEYEEVINDLAEMGNGFNRAYQAGKIQGKLDYQDELKEL